MPVHRSLAFALFAPAVLACAGGMSFSVDATCERDGDCPTGSSCARSRCVPCPVCAQGETCTGGACRDVRCDGVFCPPGQRCEAGACLGQEGDCEDRLDGDGDGQTDCEDPDCLGARCGAGRPCADALCTSAGACALINRTGEVCRAAAGVCDVEERCQGTANECPPDRFAGGAVCRLPAAPCDAAESCSGLGPDCPPDALEAAGVVCRPSSEACDAIESCDGGSAECAADRALAAGAPCRPAAGPCDVGESCDGTAFVCPAQAFVGPGIACREAAGACDVAELCSGDSAACPADGYVAAGVECRAAAAPCDASEQCSGSGPLCPDDLLKPAGALCRAGAACDGEEHCDGASLECPADLPAAPGTLCRPAAGACDAPETCSGAPECPPDVLLAPGTVCRAAAGVCDAVERCAPGFADCPADGFAPPEAWCGTTSCSGSGAACPGDSSEMFSALMPDLWWAYPQPTADRMDDVWGIDGQYWVASGAGTVLHFNGSGWTRWDTGATFRLTAIWGRSSTDIWAVGVSGRQAVHWDGLRWSVVDLGVAVSYPTALTGCGDDLWMYAVRPGAHFDGTTWQEFDLETYNGWLYGLWCSAENDVWASGSGGFLSRYDGAVWQTVNLGTTDTLFDVWGTGPGDVWVSGSTGKAFHWDGAGWTTTQVASGSAYYRLWGAGPADVWMVGGGQFFHWNGSAWSQIASPGAWTAGIAGTAADDVMVVGAGGSAYRWDGSAWKVVGAVKPFVPRGGWAGGPNDVWSVGSSDRGGAIVHFDGAGWTHEDWREQVNGVWGAADGTLWAVTASGNALRSDRIQWAEESVPGATALNAISGSAPDDVWAVGAGGLVAHFDGTTWNSSVPGYTSTLKAVSVAGRNEVWAGGDGGILYRDASGWRPVVSESFQVYGLWASGTGEAWAVGGAFAAARCNPAGCTAITCPNPSVGSLYGVWGVGPDEVYAVGHSGSILRITGADCVELTAKIAYADSIWGSGPGDIWFGATNGLLHWH